MQYFLSKLDAVRTSGLVTLLVSNIVLFFTLGFFFLKLLIKTYRCGKDTDIDVGSCNGHGNTCLNACISTGLILGKQLHFELPDQEYVQRLERGKKLFESGKVLKLVLLGGITGKNKISEAQAGKHYLVDNGVPEESVLVEDKSRHTLENLQFAREMLSHRPGQMSEQIIVLITSRYHLKRSAVFARGIGLELMLCAAEKDWQMNLNNVWHLLIEAYYLHWYFVGKYWSLLTKNKNWLQRIT